jgi:hypothetical protein
MLIELVQHFSKKPESSELLSRLEARHFIKLALNVDVYLESYSPNVEIAKDVRSSFDDIHLHVIRLGLCLSKIKSEHIRGAIRRGLKKKCYVSTSGLLRQFATHSQGLGHNHEVRQRFCSHLLHDPAAVDFGRHFTDPSSGGDLLVRKPVGH